MRNGWTDEEALRQEESTRGRDTDSSLQAQYEDSVVPDREWEHEDVS